VRFTSACENVLAGAGGFPKGISYSLDSAIMAGLRSGFPQGCRRDKAQFNSYNYIASEFRP